MIGPDIREDLYVHVDASMKGNCRKALLKFESKHIPSKTSYVIPKRASLTSSKLLGKSVEQFWIWSDLSYKQIFKYARYPIIKYTERLHIK